MVESRVIVSTAILPISHASNSISSVTYRIYSSVGSESESHAPTFFLLNGFNCPSGYYYDVIHQLAAAGFIVATASETRPISYPIPGLPLPGCPSNYTLITGPYLNALYSSNSSNSGVQIFQQASRTNGIVLLGHSNGGAIAVAIAAGLCGTPSNQTVDPQWIQTCDGYVPISNGRGRDVLKGAVVHEGYVRGSITLTKTTSISYIAGEYNNATYTGYLDTFGGLTSFTRIEYANHYAICDFIRGVNGTQIVPCALKAMRDPLDYSTTASVVASFNRKIAQVAIETAARYSRGELVQRSTAKYQSTT